MPLHELLSNAEAMFFLPELKPNSLAESEENLSAAIHEAGLGIYPAIPGEELSHSISADFLSILPEKNIHISVSRY